MPLSSTRGRHPSPISIRADQQHRAKHRPVLFPCRATRLGMSYSDEKLSAIYRRTSGYCHLCHKKLAFRNFGMIGARGAWEVDHSHPRSSGGTDRLHNLLPACIGCNRSKGAGRTRTARTRNGKRRAPLSSERRKEAQATNTLAGGIFGALIGSLIGGPATLFATLLGAHLGHKRNPDA